MSSSSSGIISDEDLQYYDECDSDTYLNDESLVYQMEKKYLDNNHDLDFIDMFGMSPCHLAVKQCLELVVLNRTNISCIGDEERFASMVKNVAELDLAWNNIKKWKFLDTALQHMNLLKVLNISYNPLRRALDSELPKSFTLNILILNGVNLPLKTLEVLLTYFPNLNELHLSDNNFDSLDVNGNFDKIFSSKISIFHLNYCHIKSWSTVLKIMCHFINVKCLYLSGNDFETIDLECNESGLKTSNVLKSLHSFCCTNGKINSWQSVDNLSTLSLLANLKFTHHPILKRHNLTERNLLLIPRITSLTSFNGSTLDSEHRITAERFLIRYYKNKPIEERPDVYYKLTKKHGKLNDLALVDLSPKVTAKVILICEENDYHANIHINLNKTVHALMKYAEKVTGIGINKMRLFHFNVAVEELGPLELRFPNQELKLLKIEDEDKFIVQSKLSTSPKKEIRCMKIK
uniref:Tubulin-specific chaperone cofactor E-like protein n=1 Tax=Parastrongyloides trichosuri TaxID=131310 RepID=A0A0N4ZBV7_PARTI